MKVLVVGGGGREHAILYKLSQSEKVTKLYCAPGNFGTRKLAESVPLKVMDKEGILDFSLKNNIDMVVVSPDDPLADGMVDYLEKGGIRAFGPCKDAARIESSKIFAKNLMKKYNIPTARYETFEDSESAVSFVKEMDTYPVVVKADGLALGKGVIIAHDFESAEYAIVSMMENKKFGASGTKIVIEEYLTGPEVTVLAFTDGKTLVPMVSSQDHKRAYDNDEGPNTGGMGAFSPSPVYSEEVAEICMRDIFMPTLEALNKEGIVYKGVIYFGLMITKDGPKVIEYNARFGDPEAQCVLARLDSDLYEIFDAIVERRLDGMEIKWKKEKACCVVLASGGYPGKYETGYEIFGVEQAERVGAYLFHAGTGGIDKCVTAGGRVLGVTALGKTLEEAILRAYKASAHISFKDMYYRKDIGRKFV